MYQISRAIYRELAPALNSATPAAAATAPEQQGTRDREQLLHSCEAVVERLAKDPYCFADPARTLFADIRALFPMQAQLRVRSVVAFYMAIAERFIAEHPIAGYMAICGEAPSCRATTRRGEACRRVPLPLNGYCPSHQHLAESADANWRLQRLRSYATAAATAGRLNGDHAGGVPDELSVKRLKAELKQLADSTAADATRPERQLIAV